MTPETITIPQPVVKHVHEAAIQKLGRAAGEITKQTESRVPDLWDPLEHFDSLRVLVEATSGDYGVSGRPDLGAVAVAVPADVLVDALSAWAQITAAVIETAACDGEYTRAGEHAAELTSVTDFMATLGEQVPA